MLVRELNGKYDAIYYISSKCRSYIPAKTIFLLPPNNIASSYSAIRSFAENTGWLSAAEEDGAVLICPLAYDGWANADINLIPELYKKVWKDSGIDVPGEEHGTVWCWETLIFAVGCNEGAVFAGNSAVAHPNYFADVVMINGVPDDYSYGNLESNKWLVPGACDYRKLNREVPVSVWMIGSEDTGCAEDYFGKCASSDDQVKVFRGNYSLCPSLTKAIMREFCTRIRWKNSPDGTPDRVLSKDEFYNSGEYIQDCVKGKNADYPFFIKFPNGTCGTGMPVLFSLHGHGEPAWLFSTKNGLDRLCDQTGEFILVLPDSPRNEWVLNRDDDALGLIIDKLYEKYGIDKSRVYLTGFSNGSMATCWFGTKHPELFAAISPWNIPLPAFTREMVAAGWEMPFYEMNGNQDLKGQAFRRFQDDILGNFIRSNGGIPRLAQEKKPLKYKVDEVWTKDNKYTPENGYKEGDRFETYVYHNLDGQPRVCFSDMLNMPHGAIKEQAKACWEFLRRFSRPEGSKTVIDSGITEPPFFRSVSLENINRELVLYVPSAGNSYTPSRAIFLMLDKEYSGDSRKIKQFLISSGWVRQANKDGSVLIAPVCPDLSEENPDYIVNYYKAVWGKTKSNEFENYPKSPIKEEQKEKVQGNVWLWEVLWNIVGYGSGADYAAECVVAHPNRFASSVLINGAASDFSYGDRPSDYFHVNKEHGKRPETIVGVSQDYNLRYRDIPSAVWFINGDPENEAVAATAEYFRKTDGITGSGEALDFAGLSSVVWKNEKKPAQRVIVSKLEKEAPSPQTIMDAWMGESIRWKNSPDGTLATFYWQDQINSGKSPYIKETYRVPGEDRDREYYMYIPKEVRINSPVVISIHGHGEPAWMFISKNGWPQIADKEKIIIVSPQDNSENRWTDEDDSESFVYLVDDICRKYSVDRTRFYVSGFSNGNMMCYDTASTHPELYAAMWPMSAATGSDKCLKRLKDIGLEMPMFGVTGDSDGWVTQNISDRDSGICKTVETFLKLSGTEAKESGNPEDFYWQYDEIRDPEFYRSKYGFENADRFRSWVFNNSEGREQVVVTVMKHMPHGTVAEESVVAWDFFKQFRRLSDGTIAYVPDEEQ